MPAGRRSLAAAIGALSLLWAGSVSAAADEGGTVITFQSMTPVTGAAVGTLNDRGIKGGGLPWMITSGSGTVDRDGHVSVTVAGLVLTAGPLAGTNPIGTFHALVSCRTAAQTIVNVETGGFPATTTGDSTIKATVDLPHPCTTPEVFVGAVLGTPPAFRWFAVSNGDFEDAGSL